MKKILKNLFLILIIAAFASIALFFAGPIKKQSALSEPPLPPADGPSTKENPDELSSNQDQNSFLLGNWKLKGEEEGNIVFLLLGTGGEEHEAGYLTDTIIVASYNIANNRIGMLSIPRDLFVKVPGKNYHARINSVKYWGDKDKQDSGIEALKNTLAEITGITIDYYVSFDFSNFEELVDTLDGIDIVLDQEVSDPKFPKGESEGYESFYLSAGIHHLDGKTALQLARSRYSEWGDFDRAERQQKVIEGIWNKLKENHGSKIDTALKYFNIWNYFNKHIETNIGLLEIRRLLAMSQNIENPAIINKVLTSKPDGELKNARVKMGNGIGFVLLPKDESFNQIRKIAETILK